ncbi:MAG: flagellar motor switch protein FliN [Thermodesulfobacteriota bacterium]|nr:flagellar motor switch protein FliN [Thermodesulfobacteriota bacterium]
MADKTDILSTFDVSKSISKTVLELFETMLSMEVEVVDSLTDPGLEGNRFVGAVSYAGGVTGAVSVHLSHAFSRLMTASMLGIELDEIEDEEQVKDVIGEVCNIVSGNLKTDLIDAGLPFVMSTPTITTGEDFKIGELKLGEPQQFVFKHLEHNLLVELCMQVESATGEAAQLYKTEGLSDEQISEKINSVDVTAAIVNSVIDVFHTMLSMNVERLTEMDESALKGPRTVGTVSFAGDVDGIFNIHVGDDFATIMGAAMLGVEPDEVGGEEEIHDVIREISNMIGGNLKSKFGDAGLACALSTPSITNGTAFTIEPFAYAIPERFYFQCQGHTFVAEAGVKREDASAVTTADPSAGGEAPQPGDAGMGLEAFQNLGFILDIPLEITVELGRTKKRINELLKLGQGSVVELEELVGEPVDVLANQTLVARGEVVVEDEKYGIRITQIVGPKQRLESLK